MPKSLILRQNKKNAKLNFLFEATFILSLFLFLTAIPGIEAAVSTYDFSLCGTTCDTSANWRSSLDDVDQFSFGGVTANRNTHNEASDAQYSSISSSNNSRWTSADPGAGDEIFMWNEMKLDQTPNEITQIDLTWEGFLTAGAAADFSVWVLKTGQAFETDASWVQVGTTQSVSGTSDTTMTKSITSNFSDYIGSDGLLTWGVYESVSSRSLNVDYVKTDVTYSTTTLGDGTDPSNVSIAPGASITDLDVFTLQAGAGTDTVTSTNITLSSGSSGGLSLVAITSNDGLTTYCSQANPSSDSVTLTGCNIPVTTTQTQFKIRITPKSHADMPIPPGSTYIVTGTITALTSGHPHSGTDTDSATVTIDNTSPANVTSASGTAGNSQVSLSWTNPADSDFHSTIIFRQASSVITDTPVEGATYIVGNTIGSATVACVEASTSTSCIDTGLSNGTVYHYKIFTKDNNVNYSATGVIPTGSPFTPAVPADSTAPAAVSDLAITSAGATTVSLSWSAPGDDNNTGTATTYDLRYSTSLITSGNFSSASSVVGEPTPSVAGSSESFSVTGLSASTLYYFALKTSDEVPNTSAISNVVSTTTIATTDTTAPATVSDLAATSVTASAVSLSWTAPGDDNNTGTATTYDLRYSTSLITSGNFSSATAASGEPAPSIAGSSESITVSGLSASTLYYFAIKTSDEVPNTSNISNVVSTTTSAAASGPATKFVIIDPSDSTAGTAVTVTVQAQRADDSINTSYQNDVTLVASGSATGGGLVDIVNGAGTIQINDSVAETVTLSLSDTQSTSLDVSSSQQVVFSSTSIPPTSESGTATPGRVIKVIFSGQAYPQSTIEVLRKDTSASDASYLVIPLETHHVSETGAFDLSLGALLSNEYFFALRAVDKDGRKTRILPYSIDLRTSDTLEVTDILMPPTLGFAKAKIRKGDSMKIIGYATPGSKTEIEIDDKIVSVVRPNEFGLYSLTTTTSGFSFGNHYARARQIDGAGKTSVFSAPGTFQISQLLVPKADLNQDNIVSVTDWSIFLFRWSVKEEKTRLTIDLNNDGKIDVKDLSIFLRTISL